MFLANRLLAIKPAGRAALAAFFLLAVLFGVTSRLWEFGVASPFTDPLDFRAFYCAGAAVARGANPYRLEPVRTCQRTVLAAAGLPADGFVLPAPLPPYALVAFAVLARLPYRLASALWMSTSILALFASIALIARLSAARPMFVGLALFLSAGIVCLSLGQVVPLVLASICLIALCARHANGAGAALAAGLASIEPHLALPVWLALTLFVPVARKPLALAAVAIAALTSIPGIAINIEYVRSMLPQHARAELLNFEGQYGLSALLAAAHWPADAALRAGTACYAIMLVYGIMLGRALERRFRDPAFLILAPVAAVVIGGPFLHIQQTVFAVPFAFLILARSTRHSFASASVVIAICLLAIPWPLADMAIAPPRGSNVQQSLPVATAHVQASRPNESIEIPYAAFIARFESRRDKHSPGELLARKIPTWFALVGLLVAASCLAFRKGREECLPLGGFKAA